MAKVGWTASKQLDSGVVATYAALVEFSINVKNSGGLADCSIEYYLDEASYDGGKAALSQQRIAVDFSALDQDGAMSQGVGSLVQAAIIAAGL